MARWQPAHSRQTSTPRFAENHSACAAPQSAHGAHNCCRRMNSSGIDASAPSPPRAPPLPTPPLLLP
eukprot:1314063-Pleurochrysis_carterae.AAC.1